MRRHLDPRPNARSNSLARRPAEVGLDPRECDFERVAFGPLFSEQTSIAEHRRFRDRTGAMEALLASELRARRYVVIGKNSSGTMPRAADATDRQEFINDNVPNARTA